MEMNWAGFRLGPGPNIKWAPDSSGSVESVYPSIRYYLKVLSNLIRLNWWSLFTLRYIVAQIAIKTFGISFERCWLKGYRPATVSNLIVRKSVAVAIIGLECHCKGRCTIT